VNGPLVVVGDALLDVDLDGTAHRLAPDAPVPVLDELVRTPRPGGAALAAAMAARDGHEVVLVTALGDDEAGAQLGELLRDVRVRRLPSTGPTPVKQRVRAGGQPLLRLDSGSGPVTVTGVPASLADLLQRAGAVLVADYGRGVAAAPALRRVLEALPPRVPTVWDPHPRGGHPVAGMRLVTPNQTEATAFADRLGVHVPDGAASLTRLRARADGLVAGWRAQAVAVTLGERGALLSYGAGAPVVVPAPAVRCLDPCGAGDRFAVTAALGLGAGLVTTEAVQEAVGAAAAYVAAGGPASVFVPERTGADAGPAPSGETLARAVSARGGTVVATGGCFDLLHAGHVATLRAARGLGDCLVVCLNSDASVRRLKGPSRPLVPAADRARVLEALEFVDAVVVFDEDTPVEVLDRIRPQVWAKGGDYAGVEVPEAAALARWGGQVVALPYLEGRSTSGLVQAAAERSTRTTGSP
jgi:D-beta-D-heptose 7-phosphate kinase/D-beta-D-heptose 1-phosphate adenosyltransferase